MVARYVIVFVRLCRDKENLMVCGAYVFFTIISFHSTAFDLEIDTFF